MFKTRTLVTSAAKAGHVKINGNVAKSSNGKNQRQYYCTDTWRKEVLEALALAELRGPHLQTLYVDHTPEPEPDIAPPMF